MRPERAVQPVSSFSVDAPRMRQALSRLTGDQSPDKKVERLRQSDKGRRHHDDRPEIPGACFSSSPSRRSSSFSTALSSLMSSFPISPFQIFPGGEFCDLFAEFPFGRVSCQFLPQLVPGGERGDGVPQFVTGGKPLDIGLCCDVLVNSAADLIDDGFRLGIVEPCVTQLLDGFMRVESGHCHLSYRGGPAAPLISAGILENPEMCVMP